MQDKYIFKLEPYFLEKMWGYEKWILSCRKKQDVKIKNGKYKDENLSKALKMIEKFPLLIKIIQANDKLSVQVHPNNKYAKKYEKSFGKTECWYIIDAKENSKIIVGFREPMTQDKIKLAIKNDNINDYLKEIKVKKGDFIYIPAGTVHCIEDGIKLLEIQQNSDITYRLYDWNRGRELHIEKAINVIDYDFKNKSGKISDFVKFRTPYFTVEKIYVNGSYQNIVSKDFETYFVVNGKGKIISENNEVNLNKEEIIYIPHGLKYRIDGNLELIKSYV